MCACARVRVRVRVPVSVRVRGGGGGGGTVARAMPLHRRTSEHTPIPRPLPTSNRAMQGRGPLSQR
eukprot:3609387-Prorocentrum_lima.AAC.1